MLLDMSFWLKIELIRDQARLSGCRRIKSLLGRVKGRKQSWKRDIKAQELSMSRSKYVIVHCIYVQRSRDNKFYFQRPVGRSTFRTSRRIDGCLGGGELR